MAEDVRSNDIDKQTSMGTYLLKQLYQQTVAWGGMIAGAYAGLFAGKVLFKKTTEVLPEGEVLTAQTVRNSLGEMKRWQESFFSKIPGLKEKPTTKQFYSIGVGALLGSMVAGIVLGYEHWKKIKQSQLQVDEITKDISDIEVFKKTDPELKAENERLWAELRKRDGEVPKSHSEKAGKKADSWKEKAEAETSEATEMSR